MSGSLTFCVSAVGACSTIRGGDMTTGGMDFFDTDLFLADEPEGNYRQTVDKRVPRQRRKYFADLFDEIQQDYNTALAKYAADNPGVSPTKDPKLTTFSSFLDSFDFDNKFFDESPWGRDANYSALNPRTKYLF